MGLDMWIRRVRKPNLEDKVYTTSELYAMNYSMISADEVERAGPMFDQLLPYTVVRNVLTEYYNTEKMIADYNLPKESHIWHYSSDGVQISGTDDDGNRVSQSISMEEINEKYIVIKTVPHYIWEEDEEAYWRKHYKLQDWFYENIDGVDNCGYYILNAELIADMNETFGETVTEDDPTDDEALFYHEWY